MEDGTKQTAEKYCNPITFAVKHNNAVRMSSRSGGFFTAVSDYVLNKDGVVYGCVLDEKFHAIHIRAKTVTDRDRMRGSKYIQSQMGDIFESVKRDLQTGDEVLFTGTSCQVAGLKSFLREEYANLLTVDIVCHGVPSPLVWDKYLEWQQRKLQNTICEVAFRNKKDYGWKAHVESLYLNNGTQIDSKVFTTLFYGHSILRPCCYHCPYKDIMHPGNITIADYWGIDKAAPGFNDDKGVSLVLINDDIGERYFNLVKDELQIKETSLKDSLQPPLIAPFPEPANREQFWKYFSEKPFDKVARKYGGMGVANKIKKKIRTIIKHIKRIFKT